MTLDPTTSTTSDPAADDGPGTDFVLIPGLWLPGSVWDGVITGLGRLGHRATVPELAGEAPTVTDLDSQLDAVVAAVDAATRPVVVGHSAAGTLAWLAADRRATEVAHVVLIGGWPESDGGRYADFFPLVDDSMPFPGWDRFEGPDAADLDDDARRRFVAAALPVPGAIAQATVGYGDERRYEVPTTLICPEFGPDEARSWVAAGDLPELARIADLFYADIDSGHWPMITRPDELAELLAQVARG